VGGDDTLFSSIKDKKMRPFTLLVKPASADCNLHCEYCFYLDKCHLYPETKRHRMSDAVLEQLIKGYMATKQPTYSIGWQGGEPTLMGLDFFRKVTHLQEKYGRAGAVVGNGLQTNVTLITDEMAEHFSKYHFLLGCSLDGPASVHDRYRHTLRGKPTHTEVLRGIETLKRNSVEFNILTLVSQSNVHRAREIYGYLVDQGFFYHQYIPCVEFDENGELLPFSINGKEWGGFMCEIFDEWYSKDVYRVSFRHFDSILFKMVEGSINVCNLGRNCCQYFVVEYNGDIYPCDFFVEESLRLGNVMDTSWKEVLGSKTYNKFGAQKAQWNKECQACDCLDLCSGDCLKHRIYAGNPPQNLSWLCEGWKQFIRHARSRFEYLAQEIRERRMEEKRLLDQQKRQARETFSSVGRNDPCPCGSGRKFKKCCGA
jgi:uncharacterized protein